MFFLFVPPRSLGRSSPNLVGRLRAEPDISSRGSFFKGQDHRGQRSNLCISAVLGPICMKLSVCSPNIAFPGPWADLHQTWWEGLGRPRILAQGDNFLKVKVKGQISVSRQSFV